MDEQCRRALRNLQIYLDHECGPDLEDAVRRHLDACAPCLCRVDFEREVRAIVAARCKDAAPSGLLDRIIAALRSA